MTVDGHVMSRQVINSDDIKNLIDYSERSDVSFSLMYEDTVRIIDESPKVFELYSHVDNPVPPLFKNTLAASSPIEVFIPIVASTNSDIASA